MLVVAWEVSWLSDPVLVRLCVKVVTGTELESNTCVVSWSVKVIWEAVEAGELVLCSCALEATEDEVVSMVSVRELEDLLCSSDVDLLMGLEDLLGRVVVSECGNVQISVEKVPILEDVPWVSVVWNVLPGFCGCVVAMISVEVFL
jgi:hypothetical protein